MNVYVSLSGGADSLAVLVYALERFGAQGVRAVHFEHGFRGQASLDDAAFCAEFCQARNVNLEIIFLDVPANRLPDEGDEAAARRLRLEAWKRLSEKEQEMTVWLGHHAGDAAETLLLRLLRGSNASGLAAPRRIQQMFGITFERPLLDWTKDEILEYLREHDVENFCTDATNFQNDYLRNYVRNELLPELYRRAPYSSGGILRTFRNLGTDADYLEQQAAQAYSKCRSGNLAAWRVLHDALLPRVLRLFLREHSGRDIVPVHSFVENVKQQIHSSEKHVRRISAGRGVLLFRGDSMNYLDILPEPALKEWDWRQEESAGGLFRYFLTDLPAEPEPGMLYFDAEELPCPLYIGSWNSGDRIFSFDGHTRSLKKIFCDRKIPREQRSLSKVLRDADGLIFGVPGLAASGLAKVTGNSRKIVVIYDTLCPGMKKN